MHSSLTRVTLLVALATAALALAGCPANTGDGPDPQECPTNRRTCDSDRVCAGGFCDKDHDSKDGTTGDGIAAADDPLGCCVIVLCTTNADCDANEKCDIRKGLCVPKNLCDPAAQNGGKCTQDDGTEADCCQSGQFCEYNLGAPSCVTTPPPPTSCFVAAGGRPLAAAAGDTEGNPAVTTNNAPVQLEAVATDDAGKNVPHATFTWATDTGTIDAQGTLTAPCATGVCAVTVTATDGAASCDGIVNVYAAPTVGSQRIVVLDLASGAPVANKLAAASVAGVVVSQQTDSNGIAEFVGVATSVSTFADDHQWHTIVDPPADVVIYTAKLPDSSKVAGIKGTFDFSKIHTTGDIKLGLSGTAIAAAITDLNFSTIIGDISKYNVNIEGITDPGGQLVPLPSGLEIELGASPIKGDYVTFGDPGRNIGWAIGGAVALADVGPIISGVAGGGDVDVGNILAGVLPFFGRFDHATITGLNLTEGTRPAGDGNPDDPIATADWPFDTQVFQPNTLLSQAVDYTVPRLPCASGQFNAGTQGCDQPADTTLSAFQSGAVLLSGVVVPGIGLVPLGLTAGLDDPVSSDTNDQRDGLIDAKDATAVGAPQKGHGLIDYAPPHDGLEGQTFITVALALDLNSITSTKGLGASIVTNVTKGFSASNTFPAGAFLEAQGGTFTPDSGNGTSGQFAMEATGTTADFWRVNLDDTGDVEWNVWFKNSDETFSIADFHPDPAAASARVKHADVQAFKLGAGYDAIGPEPTSFDELFAFNGTNLDNLLYYLGAWSSESCKFEGHCTDTTATAPAP